MHTNKKHMLPLALPWTVMPSLAAAAKRLSDQLCYGHSRNSHLNVIARFPYRSQPLPNLRG